MPADQIPQEDTWALEDLYPSDESWEQALSALTARQAEAAAFAGKLGESGETLLRFLHLVEDVDGQSELLANYAMRKADQDTRNATYQAMVGKLMGVLTAVGAAFSFATPEIMAIPEEALEGFYKAAPGLERYRRYLNNERRRREHTLSAAEERLLAAAGEMANAPETVFGAFLNADMRYPDAVDSEGKPHALSQSTFVPLEESGDRRCARAPMKTSITPWAACATPPPVCWMPRTSSRSSSQPPGSTALPGRRPWTGPMCPYPSTTI